MSYAVFILEPVCTAPVKESKLCELYEPYETKEQIELGEPNERGCGCSSFGSGITLGSGATNPSQIINASIISLRNSSFEPMW